MKVFEMKRWIRRGIGRGERNMLSHTLGQTTETFRAKIGVLIIHRVGKISLCNIYPWYWLDSEQLPGLSPGHTSRRAHRFPPLRVPPSSQRPNLIIERQLTMNHTYAQSHRHLNKHAKYSYTNDCIFISRQIYTHTNTDR